MKGGRYFTVFFSHNVNDFVSANMHVSLYVCAEAGLHFLKSKNHEFGRELFFFSWVIQRIMNLSWFFLWPPALEFLVFPIVRTWYWNCLVLVFQQKNHQDLRICKIPLVPPIKIQCNLLSPVLSSVIGRLGQKLMIKGEPFFYSIS